MLAQIKSKLLWLLTPVQKIMQKLGRSETIMTRALVDKIASLVEEGDILLSFEHQRLTSVFIKGKYDHAAILTNKMTVMEAVAGGVKEVDLIEWLYKKDHVAVIRPIYDHELLNKSYKEINKLAALNAFKYKGYPYDYQFTIANEKIYCSELVYLCYQSEDPHFLEHIHGEILPQEYMNLTKGYRREDMCFVCIINTMDKQDQLS